MCSEELGEGMGSYNNDKLSLLKLIISKLILSLIFNDFIYFKQKKNLLYLELLIV